MPVRLHRLRKEAGHTLSEVVIASGILLTIALAATTFIYSAAKRSSFESHLSSREYIVSELNQVLRDPRSLRASLERTDAESSQSRMRCLRTASGGARFPCVAMAAPAGLFAIRYSGDPDPLTAVNGLKCFQESGGGGTAMAACDAAHPIEVSVTFQIICVGQPNGGSGARGTCASNQASVITQFTVSPHSSLPPERRFRRIRGASVTEMRTLLSVNDVNPGTLDSFQQVTQKDLTTAHRQYRKICANTGEIMVGIKPDGEPLCKRIDTTCPTGRMFTGFTVSGAGAGAAFTIQAVCVDITCPLNEVLTGFDSGTGAPKCRPLSLDFCSSYSGGQPSGVFMTGYDAPDGKPICRKKTCLKGEIFGGFDSNGNAICATTAFIPVCNDSGQLGRVCHAPPSSLNNPPPADTSPASFVNPANYSGVPLGYRGIPYISRWDSRNGLPSQGWRNDYRDWGVDPASLDGYYSRDRGFLFRDLVDNRGVLVACNADSDSANLKVLHTWTYVHETVGTQCGPTPSAGDSCSSFGFRHTTRDRLNYVCYYSRSPTLQYHGDVSNCSCGSGPFAGFCGDDPDGPGPLQDSNNCGSDPRNCGCGYAADGGSVGHRCDGGEQWATRGAFNYANDQGPETCTVQSNDANGTVYADCPHGHESYVEMDDPAGHTKFHRYYNWVIRKACNFRYERGW